MTLEEAQAAKKAHIAAKLSLKPGTTVLDIGSGWGGMAMTLAKDHGADVTGVTLSTEQLSWPASASRLRASPTRSASSSPTTATSTGQFDRIVSVGMLEHVGAPNFRRLLRDA